MAQYAANLLYLSSSRPLLVGGLDKTSVAAIHGRLVPLADELARKRLKSYCSRPTSLVLKTVVAMQALRATVCTRGCSSVDMPHACNAGDWRTPWWWHDRRVRGHGSGACAVSVAAQPGPSNPIQSQAAGQCPGDKLVPPSDIFPGQKKEAGRGRPRKPAMIRNGPCHACSPAGRTSTRSESNTDITVLGRLPASSELLAACSTALVPAD